MKYLAIITHANGTRIKKQVNAHNAQTAHENAQQYATNNATVRVYPITISDGGTINAYAVMRSALQIAKRSAEKTEGNTDTQKKIISSLQHANAIAGRKEVEKHGAIYLHKIVSDMNTHAQDYYAQAYTGIIQAIRDGETIEEQVHNAYISINNYVNKQRGSDSKELRTEYIEICGGQLVSLNSYISRIIKGGERYTPKSTEPYIDNSDTMDDITAMRLGEALTKSSALLTPRQKDIVRLLTDGCSYGQICDKLHIKSDETVYKHIVQIRKITLDYFTENSPEFLYIIKSAEVNADMQELQRRSRTDRHKKKNRHSAEYYRQYRANKKEKQLTKMHP